MFSVVNLSTMDVHKQILISLRALEYRVKEVDEGGLENVQFLLIQFFKLYLILVIIIIIINDCD